MLTALYVPADRPDRFDKAVAAGPDLVILDLEDAVPVANEGSARENAVTWLGEHPLTEVRVNAVGSPWIADDLAALTSLGPVRVRLPKVDYPSQLREVAEVLPYASITCLLEAPLGVERALDIASAGVAGSNRSVVVARLAGCGVPRRLQPSAGDEGVDSVSQPCRAARTGRRLRAGSAVVTVDWARKARQRP